MGRSTPRARALPAALAAALLLPVLGCAASPQDGGVTPLEPPIRVLLLGDSISMAYTAPVREMLAERAVVFRAMAPGGERAENCEGTTKGVGNVERWLAIDGGGWDVVHFNFGLHDLKRVDPETGRNSDDPNDPRQAPPERYEEQLRAIVAALRATGARLVFATTTPVPAGGVRPHRDPEDVVAYNAIARRVMGEAGIAIDDLYAFARPRLAELQQPVNVHFKPEGTQALAREVAASIEAAAGWRR